jgi:hypothetical protein
VKLKDLVEVLDCRMQETQYYLNRKTGKIVEVQDEYMSVAEVSEEDEEFGSFQEWERECIEQAICILENEDDFLALPDQFEINEYEIMDDFCCSIEDDRLSATLCGLIRGKGAFRRFKDVVYRYGIEDQWYAFKERALRTIARDWCEKNEIPYEDA